MGEPQPGTSQSDGPSSQPKRGPGRPRKEPAVNSLVTRPKSAAPKPKPTPSASSPGPSTPARKRGRPRKDSTQAKVHEQPSSPPRRATRVSTGAMQRRSILDILDDVNARKDKDIFLPEKPENETPRPRGRPRIKPVNPEPDDTPKRGRGRPRKNPVAQDEEGKMTQEEEGMEEAHGLAVELEEEPGQSVGIEEEQGQSADMEEDQVQSGELEEEEPVMNESKRRKVDSDEEGALKPEMTSVMLEVVKDVDSAKTLQKVGESGKEESAKRKAMANVSSLSIAKVSGDKKQEGNKAEQIQESERVVQYGSAEEDNRHDQGAVVEYDPATGESRIIQFIEISKGSKDQQETEKLAATQVIDISKFQTKESEDEVHDKSFESEENASAQHVKNDANLNATGEAEMTLEEHEKFDEDIEGLDSHEVAADLQEIDFMDPRKALLEVEEFEEKERMKEEKQDPDFYVNDRRPLILKRRQLMKPRSYFSHREMFPKKFKPRRRFKCFICKQRFFSTEEEVDLHMCCHVSTIDRDQVQGESHSKQKLQDQGDNQEQGEEKTEEQGEDEGGNQGADQGGNQGADQGGDKGQVQVQGQIQTNNQVDGKDQVEGAYPIQEKYKCISCDYECPMWNRMLEHVVSHEENREKYKHCDFTRNILGDFMCPICKRKFDRKNNMKGHIQKVHYKQNKDCPICQKTLFAVDDKTFKRHLEKCEGKIFQCVHCSYSTPVSANYRKHVKVHTGQGYECEKCHRIFPTRQRYRVHCLIHDPNRIKSMCEHCGQEFMSDDAVKKHVVRVHTEVTELYQCSDCHFTAKLETDLRKHFSLVHNKKYKCGECEYRTNSEKAIKAHMEYHNPERRFPCTYDGCFYRGITHKQLTNHISQVHKTLSSHQCPICHKFYKKKTHLARHLVSHTGDKPYVCLDCAEEFTSHSGYYRHRNKTGHDAKREGIVSVPQNITIQYINPETELHFEGQEGMAIAGEESAAVEGITGEVHEIGGNSIIMVTQEEGENGQEVTYVLQMDEDGKATAVEATEETLAQIKLYQRQQEAANGQEEQVQVCIFENHFITFVLEVAQI